MLEENLEQMVVEVRKDFPETAALQIGIQLENEDVLISYEREYSAYSIIFGRLFVYQASELSVKGCVAQELAHITLDNARSMPKELLTVVLYSLSGAYRRRCEKKADLLAVERGYGPAILEFMDYCQTNDIDGEYGLTAEEIRAMAQVCTQVR